jgi:hypothetical protein
MNQVILMAVQHSFDDLLKKSPAGILIQSTTLNNIIQQLPTFQKLHDDCDLHIFEHETVVHFDDVVMAKGF